MFVKVNGYDMVYKAPAAIVTEVFAVTAPAVSVKVAVPDDKKVAVAVPEPPVLVDV